MKRWARSRLLKILWCIQLWGKRLIPLVKHSFKTCSGHRYNETATERNNNKKTENCGQQKNSTTAQTNSEKRERIERQRAHKWKCNSTLLLTDDGLLFRQVFTVQIYKSQIQKQPITNSQCCALSFASHGNPFCNCLTFFCCCCFRFFPSFFVFRFCFFSLVSFGVFVAVAARCCSKEMIFMQGMCSTRFHWMLDLSYSFWQM